MTQQTKRWLRWVPTIILIVGFGIIVVQRQAVIDWIRLYGYQPSAAIRQLADDTTMTPQARHLFYLNRPAVEAKADFARSCPNRREQSVVIGCYHPVQRGISVLKVDDARLEGIEEVTAAHEMLHAAYDRLSRSEQQQIEAQLQAFAREGLRDERVRQAIQAYPIEERANEMHSIFGTELAELPDNLRTYYTRYFSDRARVTSAAASYAAAFTDLEEQIERFDTQLETWKRQIDDQTKQLEADRTALRRLQQQMEASERNGDIAAYNAAVPVYNRQVDTYNAKAEATRSLIARHNQSVEERNAIALEEQELQRQLDAGDVPAAQD